MKKYLPLISHKKEKPPAKSWELQPVGSLLTKQLYRGRVQMSNEDLVAAIQAGDDRMGELWGQVSGFIAMRANRIMPALEGPADIDLDDLIQSGYLALVDAVAEYRPGDATFLTFLGYHLKTAFAETTRFHSLREQREAKTAVLSLDAPVTDDAGAPLTLSDQIRDPAGECMLEEVEHRIWLDQLKKDVAVALRDLPEDQRALLRQRFWDGKTLKELAKSIGVSVENVRQRERKALQNLRKPSSARQLRPYYDFDFYSGTSLGAFRHSCMTIQERYLIQNENRQEFRRHD